LKEILSEGYSAAEQNKGKGVLPYFRHTGISIATKRKTSTSPLFGKKKRKGRGPLNKREGVGNSLSNLLEKTYLYNKDLLRGREKKGG